MQVPAGGAVGGGGAGGGLFEEEDDEEDFFTGKSQKRPGKFGTISGIIAETLVDLTALTPLFLQPNRRKSKPRNPSTCLRMTMRTMTSSARSTIHLLRARERQRKSRRNNQRKR